MESEKTIPAKKGGNDDMYEGGEADERVITEVFVDPDEEEHVDENRTRILYKEVVDWRKDYWFTGAFIKGKLRRNDYHVVLSQLFGIIVLAIGAWLICRKSGSYIGITIFVPFAHYSFAAFSQMKLLNTDSNMTAFEYFCFFFAYAI